MFLGLLLQLNHLNKFDYCSVYWPLSCSCPLVWVTVSWWLLEWVACAQWLVDMALQFSVFLWYSCFCFSPGRLCIRTRFGCQERHCSGKQREREDWKTVEWMEVKTVQSSGPLNAATVLFLFRSGIQTLPHNAKVHYNYANFLKDSGQLQEAIQHYSTALRCDTDPKLPGMTWNWTPNPSRSNCGTL